MSNSEKPFACPSPGCNMSFMNEDHLTVHRKKHDMILNLGINKNNVFIVDQTPTPTRFIRNCEEVGLFQDLQHVNPFEETFRRAVEAGKSGTSVVSDSEIPDDSLHTPHIFPPITNCQPMNSRINANADIDELSLTTINVAHCENNNLVEANGRSDNTGNESAFRHTEKTLNIIACTMPVRNVDSMTESRTNNTSPPVLPKIAPKRTDSNLCINGEEVQLLLKTADGKLMQLSAAPVIDNPISNIGNGDVVISVSSAKSQSVVIKTNPPLKCTNKSDVSSSSISLAKMKLKQILTKDNVGDQCQQVLEKSDKNEEMSRLSKENRKKKGSIEQSKKQEIRERNRASSMRSRAKRKEWIQQLQRTISTANEKNAVLQLEIKNLHTEVARLKALLLAHKDCSVTKAMEKGSGVIVGPKIISDIPINKQKESTLNRTASEINKSPIILPKPDVPNVIRITDIGSRFLHYGKNQGKKLPERG